MELLFSGWMTEIDRRAINEFGLSGLVLMENAAQKTALICQREFPANLFPEVVIVAGKGNNGGDGIALSRILKNRGYRVELLLLAGSRELTAESRKNLSIARKFAIDIRQIKKSGEIKQFLKTRAEKNMLIVDAIFGTGLSGKIKPGLALEVIKAINQSGLPVLAIDIPSGLTEGSLPDPQTVVRATVTVTFHRPKGAHFFPDGNDFCGKLYVADISIPKELKASGQFVCSLIDPAELHPLLQRREFAAHKGNFGHLLSVSGSPEKPGAGLLVAEAALRSGAGLVTAACPPEIGSAYICRKPELMLRHYRSFSDLYSDLENFPVVVTGPGMGTGEEYRQFLRTLLNNYQGTLIIDADGLNLLSTLFAELTSCRAKVVLTPHPGEFSRLTGLDFKEILGRRIEIAREFALQKRVWLILKGHRSLVVSPQGEVAVNVSGNPGMATAGSGDVLSGMIAGFTVQLEKKFTLTEILKLAVFLHGWSGDLAREQKSEASLNATDLIEFLPRAILDYEKFSFPIKVC